MKREELYRKDINLGGWFSFNAPKDEWNSYYGEKMLNHFFDTHFVEKVFRGYRLSDEFLITKNVDFSNLRDKKILVIGGGPSAELLTPEKIHSYDYVFSCNHFFKNSLLKREKVDLCLIGDEVDLTSEEFNEYLDRFKPLVGFEHSGKRKLRDLVEFRSRYSKCFIYLTRYFSRLGYVPRAIILASQFLPSKIDYIGLDGFAKGRYDHFFEPSKAPPKFNEEQRFKNQMEIFLKYLLYDIKIDSDKIEDLGGTHPSNIYSGILEKIKNEKH